MKFAFIVCFMLAVWPTARAEEVADLYRAETIVTGTGEPELTRGLKANLTEVVIKLTGDTRLTDGKRLAPLLEDPHRYVKSYEHEDRMKGIPVHDEQGTRERPHFLRTEFDPADLDPELARLGLAKWSADRPRIFVFMGVETVAERYVLQKEGAQGYGERAAMKETAARLGLPVILPDAATGVSFDDVIAGGILIRDTEAYDAVLSGLLSLEETTGYWDMNWRLAWRGKEKQWAVDDVSFDEAIRSGLRTTALVLSGNEAM